jgi:hypothetical protein
LHGSEHIQSLETFLDCCNGLAIVRPGAQAGEEVVVRRRTKMGRASHGYLEIGADGSDDGVLGVPAMPHTPPATRRHSSVFDGFGDVEAALSANGSGGGDSGGSEGVRSDSYLQSVEPGHSLGEAPLSPLLSDGFADIHPVATARSPATINMPIDVAVDEYITVESTTAKDTLDPPHTGLQLGSVETTPLRQKSKSAIGPSRSTSDRPSSVYVGFDDDGGGGRDFGDSDSENEFV